VSLTPHDEFLIRCAHEAPDCRARMHAAPPPTFDIRVGSTRGDFTIHVVTAWAPPMAQRLYVLADLRYFQHSALYRVLYHNVSTRFVTQFGYRGVPRVDEAWIQWQTENITWSVQRPPGNARGTVAFGTGYTPNMHTNPNCSVRASYCSLGFQVELFINLGDNTGDSKSQHDLDSPDFSPVGFIDESDMSHVVDHFYAGYGELSTICEEQPNIFCVRDSTGRYAGVDLNAYLDQGNSYLRQHFPKLDYVRDAFLVNEASL